MEPKERMYRLRERLPHALLHIGMPKAASTYLQSYWHRSSLVDLVHNDIFQTVSHLSNAVKNKETNSNVPIGLNGNNENYQGRPMVISSEHIINLCDATHLQLFQDNCARFMKTIAPHGKVLIVTREPISWVRSYYNFSLKTGSIMSLAEFVEQEGERLLNISDISYIYNIYAELFGAENVLIMPMERLKEDNDGFFQTVSKELCMPLYDASVDQKGLQSNLSIPPDEINYVRQFNRLIHALDSHCEPSAESLNNNGPLGALRRALWHYLDHVIDHSDKEMRQAVLIEFLGEAKLTHNEDDFPEDFLSRIYANFDIVRDLPQYLPYRELYTASAHS